MTSENEYLEKIYQKTHEISNNFDMLTETISFYNNEIKNEEASEFLKDNYNIFIFFHNNYYNSLIQGLANLLDHNDKSFSLYNYLKKNGKTNELELLTKQSIYKKIISKRGSLISHWNLKLHLDENKRKNFIACNRMFIEDISNFIDFIVQMLNKINESIGILVRHANENKFLYRNFLQYAKEGYNLERQALLFN